MKNILKKEEKWLLKEKYNGEKSSAFFADLKKLNTGTPLAYLIGNIPFLDCIIDLSFMPLIPRTETEFWVNDFIKQHQNKTSIEILDIFSGSGCVGLGVLKNLKNVNVDFAELNPEYIKQIKKNLKLNFSAIPKRWKIFKSNVFGNIPLKKYDVILANPPYIAKNRKKKVQNSVLKNENYSTLFANDNGLYFIKKIITEGQNYLKPSGEMWIEFDSWQVPLINEFLKKQKIKNYKFWVDQYNKKRVLIINFS